MTWQKGYITKVRELGKHLEEAGGETETQSRKRAEKTLHRKQEREKTKESLGIEMGALFLSSSSTPKGK